MQRLMGSPAFLALFDIPWTPFFIAAIFIFHPFWAGWPLPVARCLILITLINQSVTKKPLRAANAAGAKAPTNAGRLRCRTRRN